MSLFGRFVGAKKPVVEKKEEEYDFTKFNNHVDNIDRKEAEVAKKIEDIDREVASLKEQMRVRGPNYKYLHDKALNLLRKRKMLENQMKTYTNMSINMNQTRATFDTIQVMQEQYNVMKEVSAVQNKMFQTVNIDDYLSLSDQMQDMRDEMDDVQEMMADALVGDMDEDEDELERELAMYATQSMPVANTTNYDTASAVPASAIPGMQAMPAMPAMPEFNLNDELSRL